MGVCRYAGFRLSLAGIDYFIWVDDVDRIYKELKERGAVIKEPINRDYGMRDFLLYDIDGYRFCIGGPIINT